MSASNQIPRPSAHFTAIFDVAVAEYHRVTGMRLDTHPFAAELDTCHSPEDISDLLRMQAQTFNNFHKRDEKLMTWLNPTIHILHTISAALREGIDLPFSPAKTIFTGIGVLLRAVKDEVASHETLIELFERVHFFLQCLKRYSGMSLTSDMTELLGKIMAQILSILSISTKVITGSRIKKFLKRLGGRKEVEDAFAKLDSLTKEECLMAVVRNLEVTHHVDNIVDNVVGDVKATKAIVEDIDGHVKATQLLSKDIAIDVQTTKELIRDVDGDVKATKAFTESICDNVRVVDHNLEATKHVTHELKCSLLTVSSLMLRLRDPCREPVATRIARLALTSRSFHQS
ncbi:hypothetical protein BC827DRAFT_612300 [Russula dissimulans]|nr:hypothetical protein BC827DRAFT_612300 [Russula dissimulans]